MLRRVVLGSLLIVACSAAFTCLQAVNDAVQCDAMRDLYESTAGGNWLFNAGWSDAAAGVPSNLCNFYGVSCTSEGALTQVYVASWGFWGSPHRLFPPRRLLTANRLQGTLPESLGNLSGLVYLCVRLRWRTRGAALVAPHTTYISRARPGQLSERKLALRHAAFVVGRADEHAVAVRESARGAAHAADAPLTRLAAAR